MTRLRAVNPVHRADLYAAGKFVQRLIFRALWRIRFDGREHLPPAGSPVILAANHRSLADPSMIGVGVPYPIFYFAKEELFRIPLLGWYIRRVNAFPVSRRSHDVGAMKTALKILRHGHALVLFPEGGRRKDPRRQFSGKAGVGLLAIKAQAAVVPVGLIGTDRLHRFPRVTVRYGKPMVPPPDSGRPDYDGFSRDVMAHIRRLCHVA